jgi:transposase-like protein
MPRPPLGPTLVDRLSGSDTARVRTRLVLETLSGATTVDAAAEQLGITPQRFHDLRTDLLQATVAAAEPKPLGRPAKEPTVDDKIHAALAEKERIINDLTVRIELANLREELAAAGMTRRFGSRQKKRQ